MRNLGGEGNKKIWPRICIRWGRWTDGERYIVQARWHWMTAPYFLFLLRRRVPVDEWHPSLVWSADRERIREVYCIKSTLFIFMTKHHHYKNSISILFVYLYESNKCTNGAGAQMGVKHVYRHQESEPLIFIYL